MIDSIVLANSAYIQDSVQGWELELKTCPHTRELDQSSAKKIAVKSMATCSSCELSNNLWLCLTCGYLGCGRKYFDGTGGNNHAIDHSNSLGHFVVCKLGTITPEGTAALYCYKCDDDVLDDKLKEHLSVVGIDISSQVKTEQTMTELSLQANLSMNLSKILEDGKELIPMYGPGHTGMKNLGNTCYMNACIQVLASIPLFSSHFTHDATAHLASCNKATPDCYQCQFKKLFWGLQDGRYGVEKEQRKVIFEGMSEEEKNQKEMA
jgi:ubiquitin carboxyl-terminal hydrolase 5/13